MKKALLLAPLLVGCGTTHDFVKDVEGKVYDSLAKAFSEYCEKQEGDLAVLFNQEALELRREIRQRGTHGPVVDEDVPFLDERTVHSVGPVLRVYCSDDVVPDEVWLDLVRE